MCRVTCDDSAHLRLGVPPFLDPRGNLGKGPRRVPKARHWPSPVARPVDRANFHFLSGFPLRETGKCGFQNFAGRDFAGKQARRIAYFAFRRAHSSRITPPITAGACRQVSSAGSVRIGWIEVTPPMTGVSTP